MPLLSEHTTAACADLSFTSWLGRGLGQAKHVPVKIKIFFPAPPIHLEWGYRSFFHFTLRPKKVKTLDCKILYVTGEINLSQRTLIWPRRMETVKLSVFKECTYFIVLFLKLWDVPFSVKWMEIQRRHVLWWGTKEMLTGCEWSTG